MRQCLAHTVLQRQSVYCKFETDFKIVRQKKGHHTNATQHTPEKVSEYALIYVKDEFKYNLR